MCTGADFTCAFSTSASVIESILFYFSQQARAEQEEEFISNTLFKKIQALQKEKETLAVNYEKEEEFLTNELSRKLMQVSDGVSLVLGEGEGLSAAACGPGASGAAVCWSGCVSWNILSLWTSLTAVLTARLLFVLS